MNSELIKTIKPSKVPFIVFPVLQSAIGSFFGAAGSVAVAIVLQEPTWLFFAFLAILFGLFGAVWVLIDRLVRYGKGNYQIYPEKIIRTSGGIFTDSQTELVFKNVTLLKRKFPFFEYSLFKTGHIMLESAGSGTTEIEFSAIEKADEVKDLLLGLMRENGFSLDFENEVYHTKPTLLGIAVEITQLVFVILFSAFWIFGYFLTDIPSIANSGIILVGLLGLAILILAIVLALRFLDLKNRDYHLYSSTVKYDEGFLDRWDIILPLEQVADTNINQTFLQRVLGISNLQVSTKGSNNNAQFYHISDIDTLEAKIQTAIADFANKPISVEGKTDITQEKGGVNTTRSKSRAILTTLRPNLLRLVLGQSLGWVFYILLSLFLVGVSGEVAVGLGMGIIALVIMFFSGLGIAINVLANKYILKESSIRQEYKFLTSRTVEFESDRVTMVNISRDVYDYLAGTCSIFFLSIGSGENITFRSVKYSDDLRRMALQVNEIDEEEVLEQFRPSYDPISYGLINIWGSFWFLIIAVAIGLFLAFADSSQGIFYFIVLVLGIVSYTVYRYFYFSQAKMELLSSSVELTAGILLRQQKFARYKWIKDTVYERYPLVNSGTLRLNVAGETIILTNKNANQQENQQGNSGNAHSQIASNALCLELLPNVEGLAELLDKYLLLGEDRKLTAADKAEIQAIEFSSDLKFKPSPVNDAVSMGLGLFWFPLAWPLTAWAILAILLQRYELGQKRLSFYSGIIYKQRLSILYQNIDHINKSQDLLNKLFSNGNVQVNTEGSSLVELNARNIPNYQEFYQRLQERYR